MGAARLPIGSCQSFLPPPRADFWGAVVGGLGSLWLPSVGGLQWLMLFLGKGPRLRCLCEMSCSWELGWVGAVGRLLPSLLLQLKTASQLL